MPLAIDNWDMMDVQLVEARRDIVERRKDRRSKG